MSKSFIGSGPRDFSTSTYFQSVFVFSMQWKDLIPNNFVSTLFAGGVREKKISSMHFSQKNLTENISEKIVSTLIRAVSTRWARARARLSRLDSKRHDAENYFLRYFFSFGASVSEKGTKNKNAVGPKSGISSYRSKYYSRSFTSQIFSWLWAFRQLKCKDEHSGPRIKIRLTVLTANGQKVMCVGWYDHQIVAKFRPKLKT